MTRRFGEHQSGGPLSARYLRGRGPLQLVWKKKAGDRSRALKLEYQIKQLKKEDKLQLICKKVRLEKLL